MDPRIRRHAEILVDHCTDVGPGDNVVVNAPPVADDLVVAIYELLGERDANPALWSRNQRAIRAFTDNADPDAIELREHVLAGMEHADVVIRIDGDANASELNGVDPAVFSAFARANEPIADERRDKRWVVTQFPAPGDAQHAEMNTRAYEEFVYDSVNKDWERQREFQEQLVDVLDPAEEVVVRSGDETHLRMSVDGMNAINDYGEHNLPGGEVFTAPVPSSVEGEVAFDQPLVVQGSEIENVRLVFEDGEVVEYGADSNEEILGTVLDADEGARRVGELGIGMNRDIDRFTYNVLFDEKMGDTIHIAIGRAHDECVPGDETANQSAVHEDLLVDMSEDSFIEVDGEIVQRDGTFRFEDGFEG